MKKIREFPRIFPPGPNSDLTGREPGANYSPSSTGDLDRTKFPRLHLSLDILSGQNIPRPNNSQKGEVIDPYVVVKIRGHQEDTRENKKYSSKPVRNNGFNPVWAERVEFFLAAPELAFIEFKVRQNFKNHNFQPKFPNSCLIGRTVHL